MTAPPGRPAYIALPCGEQITAESDSDLSTKNGQLRYLMRGLGVTRPQAHALIRAYVLDQRDREARKVSAELFSTWTNRRGDLILVRGKAQRPWAVTSG